MFLHFRQEFIRFSAIAKEVEEAHVWIHSTKKEDAKKTQNLHATLVLNTHIYYLVGSSF